MAKTLVPDYKPRLPAKTDYGIGIIGCGGIVNYAHLVAYRNNSLNVVACYDVNVKRRARRLRRTASRRCTTAWMNCWPIQRIADRRHCGAAVASARDCRAGRLPPASTRCARSRCPTASPMRWRLRKPARRAGLQGRREPADALERRHRRSARPDPKGLHRPAHRRADSGQHQHALAHVAVAGELAAPRNPVSQHSLSRFACARCLAIRSG